jgi:hypothetical protein
LPALPVELRLATMPATLIRNISPIYQMLDGPVDQSAAERLRNPMILKWARGPFAVQNGNAQIRGLVSGAQSAQASIAAISIESCVRTYRADFTLRLSSCRFHDASTNENSHQNLVSKKPSKRCVFKGLNLDCGGEI